MDEHPGVSDTAIYISIRLSTRLTSELRHCVRSVATVLYYGHLWRAALEETVAAGTWQTRAPAAVAAAASAAEERPAGCRRRSPARHENIVICLSGHLETAGGRVSSSPPHAPTADRCLAEGWLDWGRRQLPEQRHRYRLSRC